MKKCIMACVVALSLCACEKEFSFAMSQEAMDAVDGLCGEYMITSLEWDGGPVDLDGDGIASESFLEECLGGGPYVYWRPYFIHDRYMGTIDLKEVLSIVEPVRYDSFHYDLSGEAYEDAKGESEMRLFIFCGDFMDIMGPEDSVYYDLAEYYVRYSVNQNGDLEIPVVENGYVYARLHEQRWKFSQKAETTFHSIEYIPENKEIILKVKTVFYDFLTRSEVPGTETIRYGCVSSKNKAR